MLMEQSRRTKRAAIIVSVVFCVIVLFVSLFMNIKSTQDQQKILEDSIKSQLLSTCLAAKELIDPAAFESLTSSADILADSERYYATREALRELCDNTGSEYIYALKMINGTPEFVFDTDTEDEAVFVPYEGLAQVHIDAFNGRDSVDVNNLKDEYGTFHCGAVPITLGGRVLGVVSVDIEDDHLRESVEAARRNLIILVATLVVTMAVMLGFMGFLLRRLRYLQNELQKLAHYDTVTGLPNRQYLFEYLDSVKTRGKDTAFALLFIDLDNFKSVNDNAGHDAGDELLHYVGEYLQSRHDNSRSFRPSAGVLNVSARIGGDEFIQIVPGVETEAQAEEVARELVNGFFESNKNRYIKKYNVGFSVGVALYPYHTDNFHVLIKYADIAMYHAKHAGKNCWRIYSDDMAPKEEK